ncbi:MAG: biotin--[acetyl-CoA-carboxylase] ligase [Candidatus Nanopelagicales bacterium]
MPDQQNQLTPVDADMVRALCAGQGIDNVTVHSVVQTESTNADAAKLGQAGSHDNDQAIQVVVAATQTAGRGRLDRHWTDQGENSLSFSVLRQVPTSIRPESWGWIPLLAGLAVVTVVRAHGVDAKTKWPNDVIVEESNADSSALGYKKLAGILSEAVSSSTSPDQVVVGIGINLTSEESELPVPTATSAQVAGGTNLRRELILAEILVEFDRLWRTWVDTNGNVESARLAEQYEQVSSTIGAQVSVQGVSDEPVRGTATGIDELGQLLVDQGNGSTVTVNVGDVEQLR